MGLICSLDMAMHDTVGNKASQIHITELMEWN